MGKDLLSGFQSLTVEHGQISGFWLGPRRAVVISNFEVLRQFLRTEVNMYAQSPQDYPHFDLIRALSSFKKGSDFFFFDYY